MTGVEVRVDGFPGRPRTRHLLAVQLSSFRGQLAIEGTLYDEPGPDDWYIIAAFDFDVVGEKTISHIFDSRTVWLRVNVSDDASGTVDRIRVR